jgi:hypothetical protein
MIFFCSLLFRLLPLLVAVSIAVSGCRFWLPFGRAKSIGVFKQLRDSRFEQKITHHRELLATHKISSGFFV